jgi:hypothetical protein
LRLEKKDGEDILRELNARFQLRKMVLGERIDEFQEAAFMRLRELFYAADSEAPDLFYAKVDRMTYRIEECCKKLRNSSSKIDVVLEEIESLKQRDPEFKAVIISESKGAGQYIKKRLGNRVGIMQRSKGWTSVPEQKVLLAFQEGKFDVLVCSFESVRIGTNLHEAGAIYFVDTSINDTEHKQACNRISRCGTKHSSLTATFVYVRETLSEEIYKYHEDRRAGKTIEQAAARFEWEDVHDYSPARDFYRMIQGESFDQMKFSYAAPNISELLTSDMPIDDMFEMICDARSSNDRYEIYLEFDANKRPAFYDLAKHIVVELEEKGEVVGSGAAGTGRGESRSLRLVFDVPEPVDGDIFHVRPEILTTVVELTQSQKVFLSSIKDLPKTSRLTQMRMHLRNGTIMPLLHRFSVIRASCSCCKWCGWRMIHDYDAPFAGCFPVTEHRPHAVRSTVPNSKLLSVYNVRGSLVAKMRYDIEGRTQVGRDSFAPVTQLLREYLQKARAMKEQMGVIAHNLRYDMLTSRFFDERSDVYQKALVKLEGATVNDTIRFQYKFREYETFVREILPAGPNWYAVAYVVESEKPASTIIIERHDMMDTKRVVKVGSDVLSIKDVIRRVQQHKDSAKTGQLKTILLRGDITDAEKLELASALV